MKDLRSSKEILLSAFVFLIALPGRAFATTTTGIPVEGALMTIADSLTGPIAMAVALIGLAISAMILILGDPGKGGRMIVCVVLGFSFVTAGTNFLIIFGTPGAVM